MRVCLVLLLATAATTANMRAQTTAQPMLYAGWVLNDSFVLACPCSFRHTPCGHVGQRRRPRYMAIHAELGEASRRPVSSTVSGTTGSGRPGSLTAPRRLVRYASPDSNFVIWAMSK